MDTLLEPDLRRPTGKLWAWTPVTPRPSWASGACACASGIATTRGARCSARSSFARTSPAPATHLPRSGGVSGDTEGVQRPFYSIHWPKFCILVADAPTATEREVDLEEEAEAREEL